MQEETELQVRIDGSNASPVIVYLPGVHGDWTLFSSFRDIATEKFRMVQFTYPRTTTWRLEDYARAVDQGVREVGIHGGVVLAESFSSQVAWEWLKLGQENQTDFRFDGVILAGGFVRYSMRFNLAVARLFMAVAPWWVWRMLFCMYLAYGGFRHRHAQEKGGRGNSACDFIERRTPSDMAAMRARLGLIAGSDPRAVVRKVTCPIYQLAGFIDPVVPPAAVTRWLNRNSPSFKGHRIIWPADHNVLGTEPAKALAEIEQWIFRSACLERGDRGT